MKVCIAEKPSVAREIAYVLGASNRKDGYFEGNGYAVTWTFGHFCTLFAPDDYRPEWKRWDLNTLPMLPEKFETKLMNDSGVKKQFKVIKSLFKKATVVINCGDAGQEGELIQRWVIKEAKYKGPIERLWISSLTREAIQQGFKDIRPSKEFDLLYFAGSARAIGDWLLGMNATRLYTIKYGGGKQVLSIGRVQTPTLAMLVNRHKEIENFVSTPFWELQTNYRNVSFRYEKGRFENVAAGEELLEIVKSDVFTILSSKKKKGKEYAPKLFDLTGLQVFCNKRFGYSADQTLKLVQKLYEKKVVTYPRVDTTFLPNDVYPKIKNTLSRLVDYAEFTAPLLSKPIKKSKRVFNDKKVTDHHAIIPTGDQTNLSYDEGRVYDAIVRRFIANFYPECEVNNAEVIGSVADIKFKATGKEIINPAWKVLYPKSKKEDSDSDSHDSKEEEKILPSFKVGESGPHEPSLIEKHTQPPKYYTEATLLRGMETAGKMVKDEELRDLMKENGIGRPSTRANIIETLFRRKYAVRKKKLVLASDLGIQLIDTIQNPLLKSASLTGQWEKKIREIEAGNYSTGLFIQEMKKMTNDLVVEVRSSTAPSKIDLSQMPDRFSSKSKYSKSSKPKPSKPNAQTPARPSTNAKTMTGGGGKASAIVGHRCPKCGKGKLLKGKTAYGCSAYKAGCSFTIPYSFKSKKISDNQLKRLLAKGSTVKLKGFKEGANKIDGTVIFDDQYNVILSPANNAPVNKSNQKTVNKLACPKCNTGQIVKGKTAYGCSNWKSGCDFRYSFDEIKKQAKGQKLTKDLVERILKSG
ncbi:MAG: DNA topoisomerase-3 [Saprospiraceae bacterium]